jgi:hypothetical protein
MCSRGVLHGDISLRNFATGGGAKRIKVLDLDQSQFVPHDDNGLKAYAAELKELQDFRP